MVEFILSLLDIDAIFDYLFKYLSPVEFMQRGHKKVTEINKRVELVMPYVDAALPLMDIDVPDRFYRAVELAVKAMGGFADIKDGESMQKFVDDVAAAFGIQEHLQRTSNPVDLQRLQAELNAVKG